MRSKIRGLALVLVASAAVSAFFLKRTSSANSGKDQPSIDTPEVFSPAHPTILESVKDFFGWRKTPVQPIAFTHKIHIEHQVACTTCHKGVNSGPVAGLPSDKLCMRCHAFFAKDRPEIIKLTAIFNAGLDVSWQRVYGFSPSAHVKFNHAPHIRAGVDCSNCHGDVKNMTVAVRAVNLNMGYCLSCHRAKGVSTDCVTCHF